MIIKARVTAEAGDKRLDDAGKLLFPELSKTKIRTIIDWGGCAVNGGMIRVASRFVKEGDEIIIGVMEPENYIELHLSPEDLLFENEEFIVVNKMSGINSQRTPYQLKGTLEHAVTLILKMRGLNEPSRIVHRLDRGTSGVMIFPKSKKAAAYISHLLHEGQVDKVYWALVEGNPEADSWEINAPIAKIGSARYGVARPGKEAVTKFSVLARGEGACLIEARPLTGRTHQIRVHLAHCGHPVVGDKTYGQPGERLMLHCREMSFVDAQEVEIRPVAPVDEAFVRVMERHSLLLP